MSKEAMKLALEAAYLAGFNASGEGYNGEYPFQDYNKHPEKDAGWCQNRDAYVREALAEQPAQQIADSPDDWSDWRVIPPQSQPAPMIRGDIRDGLVDDEPAHQHIEHCLWARNGNQPCPHVKPAQQQEPVGRLESDPYEGHVFVPRIDGDWSMLGEDLYTSPQAQRTWAGLTDEDIKEAEWLLSAIKEHEAYTLQEQLLVEGVDVFARAIEAKLREKNA